MYLGDYGAELRRQQRLEAIAVAQYCSPASEFSRRQYSLIQSNKPRYQQNHKLPRCAALTRCGPRFLGPRVS